MMGLLFQILESLREKAPQPGIKHLLAEGHEHEMAEEPPSLLELLARPIGAGLPDGNEGDEGDEGEKTRRRSAESGS